MPVSPSRGIEATAWVPTLLLASVMDTLTYGISFGVRDADEVNDALGGTRAGSPGLHDIAVPVAVLDRAANALVRTAAALGQHEGNGAEYDRSLRQYIAVVVIVSRAGSG